MYQFFVENAQIKDNRISIVGDDVNHMKNVLRMKMGDCIRICEEGGKSYLCAIETMKEDEIIVQIQTVEERSTELNNPIYLFQGLPKSDKMELVIQKAVELGACEIIPVAMKNCVVKLDEKKAENKRNRWQAIAESAAKQSKRMYIPKVRPLHSWKMALEYAKELDIVLLPYENERGMKATRELISGIEPGQSIGIFIGPEGGYSVEEIDTLPEYMHKISLGRRILRTETAGLATLAMLIYQLDE